MSTELVLFLYIRKPRFESLTGLLLMESDLFALCWVE